MHASSAAAFFVTVAREYRDEKCFVKFYVCPQSSDSFLVIINSVRLATVLEKQLKICLSTGEKVSIDISTNGLNQSELVYTRRFEVPSRSFSSFEIRGLDQKFFSYVVFQLHTFYYNVSLTLGEHEPYYNRQNGTNIGFALKPGRFSQTIKLQNDNYDDVQCFVAIVAYDQSAPIIGGSTNDELTLNLKETDNFIIARTSSAKSSDNDASEPIQYFTYFLYLEQMNFSHEAYFEGIKNLMFSNASSLGYQVSQLIDNL